MLGVRCRCRCRGRCRGSGKGRVSFFVVLVGVGGKCSFRTVDTLLVKHCDVGMRLRYEIECIGYVGLFRPRTPDSRTTFRLPAGGRGDVIVALEPVQWANNFRLIPYGERPRLYCDTGGAQLGVTVRMA